MRFYQWPLLVSGTLATLLLLGEGTAVAQKSTYQLSYQDQAAPPMPMVEEAPQESAVQSYDIQPQALPSRTPLAPQVSPCGKSHKSMFYDNDFSYLEDPCNNSCCLGDAFKRLSVGPGCPSKLDMGGQFRLRYHHEEGMGQEAGFTRFQNTSNDFLLERLRLYANYEITPDIRFYAEGIFADVSEDSPYVPRGIDRNRGDLLNLFLDLKLFENLTVRVGRQELLYGNQRTVSPLDWSNTRRRFEGVKALYQEGDWAIDAFFTHFVNVDVDEFDSPNYDQPFYGAYGVYSGYENSTLDLYYLGYENQTAGTPVASNFDLHTFGARLNGSHCSWLYELEGAGQYGEQNGLNQLHEAYFATVGLGRKFENVCWKPTVWFYYDYASGDTPGGKFTRYNHLFPLAHKYLGFIDAVQRSNIEAPNVLVTMSPHKKVKLLLWYYHFMSNKAGDIVPALGGTPAQSLTSRDLGDEIDLLLSYKIGPRSDILFGYSHFWRGNKINAPNDADFFYTQFQVNF